MADTVAIEKKSADYGKSEYGCEHYRRRCKIRAPCCDKVFTCRHCHNEATSLLKDLKAQHEIVRHEVKRVICAVCDTEQEVAQVCMNCGVNMGEYFCGVCKFYDDETEKQQFHCEECGICRVGGRENFFHCPKCGSCYQISLHGNHSCVENSMKNHCPVCYEYLFDSIKPAQVLKCGHTIHKGCFEEMAKQNQYRCPICFKSVLDMESYWKMIDDEIAETAMPDELRKEVDILCNDCHATGKAPFHIFGLKCSQCNSYNTRRTGAAPQEEQNPTDLSSSEC